MELLKLPNTRIFKDMNINDILGNGGDILTLEQFSTRYDTFIDRMTASIPKSWKEILKLRMTPVTIHKTTTVRARGKLKDVTEVSNKALYWIAIDKICKEPTAVETWMVSYPFLTNAPWHKIFKLMHRISPEPYLHSFQYKIVNRILNCGTNLYKWKLKDSPTCGYCNNIDTIEHHLFSCFYAKPLWLQISKWLNNIFGDDKLWGSNCL